MPGVKELELYVKIDDLINKKKNHFTIVEKINEEYNFTSVDKEKDNVISDEGKKS